MAGAFEVMGACGVPGVRAVASVRSSAGQFFVENSTVGLGGEKVHTVGNVKSHLVAILVTFLQDSSAQFRR